MTHNRVGHALFCDDIRFEVGNKLSFMGVYTTDIGVNSTFPCVLAKLGLQATLITDVDDRLDIVTLRVVLPDGSEVVKEEIKIVEPRLFDKSESITKRKMSVIRILSPLTLPCSGFLEAWFDTDTESMRAGRLWIHRVEHDPTVA